MSQAFSSPLNTVTGARQSWKLKTEFRRKKPARADVDHHSTRRTADKAASHNNRRKQGWPAWPRLIKPRRPAESGVEVAEPPCRKRRERLGQEPGWYLPLASEEPRRRRGVDSSLAERIQRGATRVNGRSGEATWLHRLVRPEGASGLILSVQASAST